MGPDNKRVVIATVITVAIMLVLNSPMFFGKKHAPAVAQGGVSAPAEASGAPSGPGPGSATQAAAPASAVPAVTQAPEQVVTLKGLDFEAKLSSWGGALESLELTGKKFQRVPEGSKDGVATAIELVTVEAGSARPFSLLVSKELGGSGAEPLVDRATRASMEVAERTPRSVTFTGREGVVGIRKTYRLTDRPYELELELEVTDAPAAGSVSILVPGFMPPATSSGGFFSGPPVDFLRPVCRGGDKTERYKMDGDAGSQAVPGAAGWVGIDRHYFTSVILPKEPEGACGFVRGATKGSGAAILTVPVAAGATKKTFAIFAGPKRLDLLKPYGRSFESVIDYGPVTNLFALFAQVLLNVMRWFHGFIGNWGVAIILLTLSVKLLLYPLTLKSMQSMSAMRRLQPQIEKLKAKHGDDKEKLNLAVMQMYQQNKVNPLGGCLPMLLQMPIWFALYASLQTSVELYREPFLWMTDLTLKDPYYILPVAMGVTSFLMQKLSPQPADNAQAKMMLYFFPAFFSFMMLFVPSGLTLYIFVNNLLSIVQQQVVNRMQEKSVAAAS